MAVWETEDEMTEPMGSLPTPTDSPHRAPAPRNVSRSSRKSKRSTTPPGKNGQSSSPPPLPGDRSDRGSKRSSRDVSNDDSISPFDPRRFTPTLHASLVSEILNLRRDQEEKLKIIESLETSLHGSREETESLQATVVSAGKEGRSLKRQLALLEGGTSSALGELARERDEAVETATEIRKRLEGTQRKLRSQEEDSERVHRQWAKEKDEWEEEKRKYERRIHVTETRLKVVLDEVAAYQIGQTNGASRTNGTQDGPESDVEEAAMDNDGASVRTMSLTNSIRFSATNGIGKINGNSLADELGSEGGFDDDSDYGGRESALSHNGHLRNMSRESILSRTHWRRQSNEGLMRSGSTRGRLALNQATLDRLEDGVINEDDESQSPPPKPVYIDTGVQYSPPPSPKASPAKPSTPEPVSFFQKYERLYDADSPPRVDLEIEANQRRKRVHVGQPLKIQMPTVNQTMVNGSSQTVEEPPSPPRTPRSPLLEEPKPKPATTTVASTQTDIPPSPPPLQPFLMSIPSISVIPPSSRPATPREPRLPQLSKDVGCQVSLITGAPTASVAVQTEEIRIDKRLDRLPLHLHPSSITSRPSSPVVTGDVLAEDTRQFTPIPGNVPPRNPRRLANKRSLTEIPSSPPLASSPIQEEETHDAYPGNNDDGPLSGHRAPIRRPHQISSLFAGFDGGSSDEVDEFMDPDQSDSEYRTALSAPRHNAGATRGGKRVLNGGVPPVETAMTYPRRPSGGRYVPRPFEETDMFGVASVYQTRESFDSGTNRTNSKREARPSMLASKSSVMRKAAMIQNGIVSHQRARSPSLTDIKEPPFPIPTRASSRKMPHSVSAPSDGRASPTRGTEAWQRRGNGRSHYRAGSVRKVRSATGLPRNQKHRRQGSRSPPFSPSTEAPESPGLPPMPDNDITTPRNRDSYIYSRFQAHKPQLSINTANTADTGAGSQGSSNQAIGVVDAIAQTMVGEWMFKYVRRRKSFGVSDSKAGDDNSNDRHKRWVWLAPYERAILWSSKQPSSGSALMGKSGRKLTIQSVLDVKDDNPPPKGSGSLFNRSILILTPQRALKFTATSADRHYIWLTSLSFLAHSNQDIPESLAASTQPKPLPEQYQLPKPKTRRPIRDSIRLTKAKAVVRSGPTSIVSSQADSAVPSMPTYRPPIPEEFKDATHVREISIDPAEPPIISRFHDRGGHAAIHGRKRSNTGGHVPPPLSFRGFSGPAGGSSSHHAPTNSTAGNSILTAGSSDIYSNGAASSAFGSSGMTWATGSIRTSEASSRPSGMPSNNFFDAIGTMRMEAFISPLAFSRFEETPLEHEDIRRVSRRRSKELRRRVSRSRQRESQSRGTRGTDEMDEWYRDDPFRGF